MDSSDTPYIAQSAGRWRTWLERSALLLLALLIYIPIYQAPAHWDDGAYMVDNVHLRSLRGLWLIWFKPHFNWQYYPVVFTSFWIEYHLWGATLWAYHLVNAALHGINAILLLMILRRLNVPVAFLIAVIFACHPIHVETVVYIAERKNLLSCLFFMLAMLAYWRFTDGAAKNKWWAYAGAMVCFILAIQSKTVVAVFPAIMLLVLFYQRGKVTLRDVWPLIPFVLVAMPQSYLVRDIEHTRVGAWGERFDFNPAQRILIAGRCLWFYIGKIVWPNPLVPIYERWTIDSTAAWQYLFPAAYAALAATLVALRRKIGEAPWILAAAFFIILAPALGFVSYYPMTFSFVSDHFVYLGSIPAIMAVVLLARWGFQRAKTESPAPAQITVAVMLVILTGLTVSQGLLWRSERVIWQYNFMHNPESPVVMTNLGIMFHREGENEAAKLLLEKAAPLDVEIQVPAYTYLSTIATKEGNHQLAAEYMRKACAPNPRTVAAWMTLGTKLQYIGEYGESIAAFGRAAQILPTLADPWAYAAESWMKLGDAGKATRAAQWALEREPDNARAKQVLAAAQAASAPATTRAATPAVEKKAAAKKSAK